MVSKVLLGLISFVAAANAFVIPGLCCRSKPTAIGIYPEEESIDFTDYGFDRRRVEFELDDSDWLLSKRRNLEQGKLQNRFKAGDSLIELRNEIADLREELKDAKKHLASIRGFFTSEEDEVRESIQDLEAEISAACSLDPEFCYVINSEIAASAEKRGDIETALDAQVDAQEARSCIPQLNLHGLWIGKYDENCHELINVTYAGDTLIATKVTGDENVPRGEVTFTCDLSPRLEFQSKSPYLAPLELNDKASRHWGKRFLPRFSGKGQVASPGFQNAKWVPGQIILVGNCFSFAWTDTGHKVFFSRPSPEQVLKMFRTLDTEKSKKDPVSHFRKIAENMIDDTEMLEQDLIDTYEHGCFE